VSLLFLLGGARSGKSALAVRLAREHGGRVVFVATAEPRDDEMRARIQAHRAERPSEWQTVEEPIEVRETIDRAPADALVVVDCLTLWTSNLLDSGHAADEIETEALATAVTAAARAALVVAVSNEVGLGIVPAMPLGRLYRDMLGRTNAHFAAAAERSALVVAGRVLELAPPEALLPGASRVS
jgi:adenosylcobinamide kinase/adenosylcobinamide-phosphate guanylyltransferase